jgi:hypothetical protein
MAIKTVVKMFFNNVFLASKEFFFELFFLLLMSNCLRFVVKKEKSLKFFYALKTAAKWRSGYTYPVGYTHRVGCI